MSAKQIVVCNMQGSIRKSLCHDQSLLRVFERYSAQYRSLKENSDNWAQKLWGGHRRQSWETRNGGIQSKIIRILLENTPSFAKLNPKSFAIKSQVKTSKSCILIIYPLVSPDWIGWRPIIQEIIRAGKDWSRKCGEERKMNVAQIWKMLRMVGGRSDK